MKVVHVLRAPGNYDVDEASEVAGIAFDPDEGKTQQSFATECDINEIVRRFGITGELPVNQRMPVSGDFTGITDFQSAMEAVVRAQGAFNDLPANVRARFRNDPAEMLAFLEDGKNREEAVKLGLVNPPPEVTRDVVQAVDELAAKLTPKS